ncbi:hypothetical protein [Alteribacter keqinensis]|nr:hypothetical protein [Alteribacter keqinensis]
MEIEQDNQRVSVKKIEYFENQDLLDEVIHRCYIKIKGDFFKQIEEKMRE